MDAVISAENFGQCPAAGENFPEQLIHLHLQSVDPIYSDHASWQVLSGQCLPWPYSTSQISYNFTVSLLWKVIRMLWPSWKLCFNYYVFTWIDPLVSDQLIWQNGKNPIMVKCIYVWNVTGQTVWKGIRQKGHCYIVFLYFLYIILQRQRWFFFCWSWWYWWLRGKI